MWGRGVRTVLCVIFLCLPSLVCAQASGQTHRTLPSTSSTISNWQNYLSGELADRHKDGFSSYVVSGGTHATSGTMVSAAFATTAYGSNGNYISQSSAAIDYSAVGCSGTDTGWVVVTESLTDAPSGNFVRVAGTRYLVDCVSSTEPSLPTASAWLMKVTIAGSAITQVDSLQNAHIVPLKTITTVLNLADYGASPSATDNGVLLTRALAALPATGGKILVPHGLYLFTTGVSFKDLRNIVIECVSIAVRAADSQSCTFQYTASSGSLFSLNGAVGVTLRGLGLVYSHGAYADVFVNLAQGTGAQNTSQILMEDCRIGGTSTSSKAATVLIQAAELVYDITIQRCVLLNGAIGIRGSTSTYINANIVTIRQNLFLATFTDAMIRAGGTMWTVEGNTFEPRTGSKGNAFYVEATGVVGLRFTGNWLGDGNDATTAWFQAGAGVITGGVIAGNSFSDINASSKCIDMSGSASPGITIMGNDLHCGIGLYNLTGLVAPTILGNSFSYGSGARIAGGYPSGKRLVQDGIELKLITTDTAQTSPLVSARADGSGSVNGNSVEWGHPNVGGFANVLGYEVNSGKGFVCLSCEQGTNPNTYKTRGKLGVVVQTDLAGRMVLGAVDNSNADNQGLSEHIRMGLGGHLEFNGAGFTPSLSGCGTNPSLVGSDNAGRITVGTGGGIATCTVTFVTAWTQTPACIVQGVGTNQADIMTQSLSTTQFQLVRAGAANIADSTVVAYHCLGRY